MALRTVVTGRFIGGALFSPKRTEEDKAPKYSCVVVLDDGEDKKLDALVAQAIQDKWSGKQPPGMQNWVNRIGDDPDMASFEKHYINPKTNGVDKYGEIVKRPGTFVKRGGAVKEVSKDDDIIYSGCYIAIEVDVFPYDGDKAKSIKPGITLGFNKVLFLKDGDRLSNQTRAEDAFADFDSDTGTADTDDTARFGF